MAQRTRHKNRKSGSRKRKTDGTNARLLVLMAVLTLFVMIHAFLSYRQINASELSLKAAEAEMNLGEGLPLEPQVQHEPSSIADSVPSTVAIETTTTTTTPASTTAETTTTKAETTTAATTASAVEAIGEEQRIGEGAGGETNSTTSMMGNNTLPPLLSPRRYLFGIFSYDNPNARLHREGIRKSYLSYYTKSIQPTIHPSERNTICSLNQLLANATLQADPRACLFVYTFVMGGGDPKTQPPVCYYPECGDKADDYIVAFPNNNYSDPNEIATHNDLTFLTVKENADDGKSETWFTYAAALIALDREDLNIQYAAKIDSDAIMFVNRLWNYTHNNERQLRDKYVLLGWFVTKKQCSTGRWDNLCKDPLFKAPKFALGGTYIISKALLRNAYLDGSSSDHRRSLHFPHHEDMSQGNMMLGNDSNVTVDDITLMQLPPQSPASHAGQKTPRRMYKNYFQRCGCLYNNTKEMMATAEDWPTK